MTLHWLSIDAVLAVHLEVIEAFGGTPGLRDRGLLESAVMRPQVIFEYEPTVPLQRLAAAYAFGIVQNHPFVDGNKRCGFLAAYIFLDINGMELTASEATATQATIALAAGEIDEAGFAAWLADNCSPAA
jgi:death-on-curing protein